MVIGRLCLQLALFALLVALATGEIVALRAESSAVLNVSAIVRPKNRCSVAAQMIGVGPPNTTAVANPSLAVSCTGSAAALTLQVSTESIDSLAAGSRSVPSSQVVSELHLVKRNELAVHSYAPEALVSGDAVLVINP